MFNWFFNLFKSDKKKLSEQMLQKQEVVTSVKNEYYHEIISLPGKDEFMVRLYSRKEGFITDVHTSTPHETALMLLNKYNKG